MAVRAPVVAGKYTLLRRLGAGGMAEVFLAKQDSGGNFEKLVVIKRILPHLTSGAASVEFVRMFLDEARLASDLRHPNIVTVIDIGKANDAHYIVMEFLHGQDVRKLERKSAAWQEHIPLGHCCQIAIDAAAGLHYAHRKTDLQGRPLNIVHRDVSPQNIVVTYEGGTKIVDFGIAKAATQTVQTAVGVLKGKYTYMSPEQAAGEIVDARTDQFALGIVLWELLTMRRLFKRDSESATLEAITACVVPRPSKFRPDLPRVIDDVVMTALERDKRDRYPDCEALALALEDACSAAGIVHSRSRLSLHMRRLFADALAEEATLGLVNPDGSVSRNFLPFTLARASSQDALERVEAPRVRQAGEAAPPGTRPTTMERPLGQRDDSGRASAAAADDAAADDAAFHAESSDAKNDTALMVARDFPPSDAAQEDPDAAGGRAEPARTSRAAERRSPQRHSRGRGSGRDGAAASPRVLAAGMAIASAMVVIVAWAAYTAWVGSGTGKLIVRTTPVGAAVFIDGKDTGQMSPALLENIDVGVPHRVRVVLTSRPPVEDVVVLQRRGATETVKIEFPSRYRKPTQTNDAGSD